MPTTSARNHRPDGPKARHELTIKADQSNGAGHLRLLIVPDLWRDRDAWADISLEEFRQILCETKGLFGSLPFDTVYTSATGYIARQVAGNNPRNMTLTWRLNFGLSSEIIVPLNVHQISEPWMIQNYFHGYDYSERFQDIIEKNGFGSLRVVDLNFVFNLLIGITEIHQALLAKVGWDEGYFAKSRLLNVWRTVPFIDVSEALDEFEKHGIPMCLDSEVTTPAGFDPETFIEVGEYSDVADERAQVLLHALAMFAPIARAFGVPAWITGDSEDDKVPYYQALQLAGQRAMGVQRARNKAEET